LQKAVFEVANPFVSFSECHRAATGPVLADAVLNRSNSVSGRFLQTMRFSDETPDSNSKTHPSSLKKRLKSVKK
jgi:hypothetical protein